MKLNHTKLLQFIQNYKQLLQSSEYDEMYKWAATKNFTENWNENAPDMAVMIDRSLDDKVGNNLWAGQNYFPKRMLLEMARFDGRKVSAMFKSLFDESLDLEKRVLTFWEDAENMSSRAFPSKSVYQDSRAIMVYLGLRFPDKYPLYKYKMFREFARMVEWHEPALKGGKDDRFKPVRRYLDLCKVVREVLENDREVLDLHRARLNPSVHFTGEYGALLTQDFIYCTAYFGKEKPAEDEEAEPIFENPNPTVWLFAPGANAHLWQEFQQQGIMAVNFHPELGDLRQYPDKIAVGEKLQSLAQTATEKVMDRMACWEFAFVIRPGDIVIAKQGRKSYLGWGIVRSDYRFEPQRPDFQHIRDVEWMKIGEWAADFPLVTKTLTDISKYPEYAQRLKILLDIEIDDFEETPPNFEEKQFWWLNANPKIWGIDQTKIGQTQTYTSHNDKGNKRQKYKYFTQVKPGDIVVGYETTPVKKIKALFEITEALHAHPTEGEVISFRKTLDLRQPIDYDLLQNLPDLENCEPLRNNQGSLFWLREEEYDVIRDIIDTAHAEAEAVEKSAQSYSRADALRDLFLSEEMFDKILRVLRQKKNIVLQGAPGVGKTFVAKRIAKAMLGKDDERKICMVQFHQSYSYEDFVMGIRPNSAGGFMRRKGVFFEFCERAQNDPASDYFFIIDEINRGNLSKIFGELMLLIEADKRGDEHKIPLTYSEPGEKFFIPTNLHFIGTMNTADRSLAMVDYALRRRFAFLDLEPEFGARFAEFLGSKNMPEKLVADIQNRLAKVNEQIAKDENLGKGFRIGHSYFCNGSGTSPEQWYHDIVEMEIAPQLREYWFDDEDKANDAVQILLRT